MRLYLKIEKISCQWLVICFRRALEVDPMLVPASKQFRSTALQCTCASKIWKRKDGSCCTSQASKVSSCFTETSLKIALAAWMWQKRTAIALFRDCLSFCISGCGWQIEDLFQYKDTYMYIYIYIIYIYISVCSCSCGEFIWFLDALPFHSALNISRGRLSMTSLILWCLECNI